MKYLVFILGILVMLMIVSCDKEEMSRNQFQGVWKIVKFEQTYYSDSSEKPQPDSVIVTNDAGVFMLVDRADFGNMLDYDDASFQARIPKFYTIHGGGWSSDYTGTRLSLSGVVYTVDKIYPGRYKLTYVEGPYLGIFKYKEELTIDRINP